MRRFYLLLICVVFLALIGGFFALPNNVNAAPPSLTLVQARNQVDNWLLARWPTIQSRQETYLQNNGRYWQGLRSNISNLTYTELIDPSLLANNLASSPTDQPATWLAVFPELAVVIFPAVVWIDTYDGPSGMGYVANVLICYNENCYTRSQNVGPESWRTAAWSVIPVIQP